MSNKQKLSCEEKAIRAQHASQQRLFDIRALRLCHTQLVDNAGVSGVTDTQRLGER